MATKKRQVRTRRGAKPTLRGTINYAACAARGFHRFLRECAELSVTRQFDAPENQAIPILGRITKGDPDLARLATINVEQMRAKLEAAR